MNLIISRRSKRHWLPAYLKPINTHPTLREGQNRKLYGSGEALWQWARYVRLPLSMVFKRPTSPGVWLRDTILDQEVERPELAFIIKRHLN